MVVLIKSACTSGTSTSRSIFWCNKIKVAGISPEKTAAADGWPDYREKGEKRILEREWCVFISG